MTQTLPLWLPAVIAGGLYAAVGWVVVGVASAGLDWAERRKARRTPDADRTAGPRRALDASLGHETGSRVPVLPESAERRSETAPRKEARMTDAFYDDAHLCTALYPGDDTHAGQLCHEQAGHDGDHRAIAELGPGWRRFITWPNTAQPTA